MADTTEIGSGNAEPLKLAVVDAEDLSVVSAHLQDAETSVAEMAYLPGPKRFALVMARFDWTQAAGGQFWRCRSGLHFERVLKAAHKGFRPDERERKHQLLAIAFLPDDAPAGTVLLTFSGGGQIRLAVECLEAQMRDMGPRWPVDARPGHRLDDGQPIP